MRVLAYGPARRRGACVLAVPLAAWLSCRGFTYGRCLAESSGGSERQCALMETRVPKEMKGGPAGGRNRLRCVRD